ncbi:MAG: hypothetical protein CUN56_14995, partial [Phototrophicales bacterium]
MKVIIALLILILTACVPDETLVTSTPTQLLTPEPTPTIEIWDGHTPPPPSNPIPAPSLFVPFNPNPDLLVDRVDRLIPDRDGEYRRWQCIPRLITVDIQFPQPNSVKTPPFINCDTDNRDNGLHEIRIDWVDGIIAYRIDQIELHEYQCYLMKIVGSTDISGEHFDSIGVRFGYEDLGGAQHYTERQPLPQRGEFEIVAAFRNSSGLEDGVFVAAIEIDWATYTGTITLDRIEIMRVPGGYCENGYI